MLLCTEVHIAHHVQDAATAIVSRLRKNSNNFNSIIFHLMECPMWNVQCGMSDFLFIIFQSRNSGKQLAYQ